MKRAGATPRRNSSTAMAFTPPRNPSSVEPQAPGAPCRRVVFSRMTFGQPCNLLKKEYMCDADETTFLEISEKIITSHNSTLVFCKGVADIYDIDANGEVHELTHTVWPPSRTHKPGFHIKGIETFKVVQKGDAFPASH